MIPVCAPQIPLANCGRLHPAPMTVEMTVEIAQSTKYWTIAVVIAHLEAFLLDRPVSAGGIDHFHNSRSLFVVFHSFN